MTFMDSNVEFLGLAYRKAKVDYFYSPSLSLEKIASYESKLYNKLSKLNKKINGEQDSEWVKAPDFLGGYTYKGKSFQLSKSLEEKINQDCSIFSSPVERWQAISSRIDTDDKKPTAEFRLMEDCSIDFHVLSSYWMMKVGRDFDSKLSGNVYGNRLRAEEFAHGSFQPYFRPYRQWRDNGIKAIQEALDKGKKVITLTADVNSFYHELNPHFMLDKNYLKSIGLEEVVENELKWNIHNLFIEGLKSWAKSTPLKKGLPVGLPASSVVANLALIKLDEIIENEIKPIYYGRYVDDIILVIENNNDLKSIKDLWKWIAERSNGVLKVEEDGVVYQPNFLIKKNTGSDIRFTNEKNKVFALSGSTGKSLLLSLKKEINERSSEWRAAPQVPADADEVGAQFLTAIQADGEQADNLRKTDAITIRKSNFALRLRDLEAYANDLPPENWQEQRKAFFQVLKDYVMTPMHFFELADYFPRIVQLATVCGEFEKLHALLEKLDNLEKDIKTKCEVTIKALGNGVAEQDKVIQLWMHNIYKKVKDNIISALPPDEQIYRENKWAIKIFDFIKNIDNKNFVSYILEQNIDAIPSIKIEWNPEFDYLKETQKKYFIYDLCRVPFRALLLPKEFTNQILPVKKSSLQDLDRYEGQIYDQIEYGLEQICSWSDLPHIPNGLLFATRPLDLPELIVLARSYMIQQKEEKA